jgi:hypothetical protein
MRPMMIGMLAVIAVATSTIDISTAYAQSCFELWIQRNSIYKRAGYCFKTPRAISYFGNAGCLYDDEFQLPLSPGERSQISRIQAIERRHGCR